MSNIAELRALEEFLMGEEDLENVVKEVEKEDIVENIVKNIVENIVEEAVEHVEETVSTRQEEITISDEEATKLIEKIKELSVYEEMSDDEDNKSSVDEKKKNVWSTIRENMTSMMNKFQSFLSSK